jgi:AraC-like DNA-binding protein
VSEPLQRVGPLAGIPALLQELGVETDEVLEGLEIRREDLFIDNRIPFRSALGVLDRCAQASGCDHFGALLGTRFEFSAFGLIAEALKCAPTLRDAIEDFVSVQAGFSQGLCWYFVPFDDCAAFGVAIYDRHHKGKEQLYGFNVAFAVNGIRAVSDGNVDPIEVHFNHRAPGDQAAYHNLLRCPVLFSQDQTCILLSRQSVEWKNPRADAGRRKQLLAEIRKATGQDQLPALVRLRHEFRPLFSRGIASLEAAAERLVMHPRSLNRHLKREGTTFAEERDRARYILASELLAATDLPVGAIAAAVAYEDHSAFVRAFRKWSDDTPSDWRSRSKQDEADQQEPGA